MVGSGGLEMISSNISRTVAFCKLHWCDRLIASWALDTTSSMGGFVAGDPQRAVQASP